jgi:signal transduction histidine kinase
MSIEMDDQHDLRFGVDAALHLSHLLALAGGECDMLAAFSLNVAEAARLFLLYLDFPADNSAFKVTLAASYPDQHLVPAAAGCDLLARSDLKDLVTISLSQHDPILFSEDITNVCPDLTSLFNQTVHSVLVLRLSGKATALQDEMQAHALLCMVWPTHHTFSSQEKSFYAAVLDVAAAVVSNYRLRLEALANVERLRELDRLKTKFLASVSHELRTPLTGIIALSSGILEGVTGESNAATYSDVELIYRAGEQLRFLITDILDYARLESEQPLPLDIRPFQIEGVLVDVVALAQPLIGKKQIQISVEIPPNSPLVMADSQRVHQILTNLIGNAIKFSERGEIKVTVRASVEAIVVCVSDEGPGIAPEYHQVIFEPFRQLQHIPTHASGAGLGLSICKQLLGLMNGQIWVESQVGNGSCFYFSLPQVEAQ